VCSGGPVSERRLPTARKHRRRPSRRLREPPVPEDENPSVNRLEPEGSHRPGDLVIGQPGGAELRARDDPVLALRELCRSPPTAAVRVSSRRVVRPRTTRSGHAPSSSGPASRNQSGTGQESCRSRCRPVQSGGDAQPGRRSGRSAQRPVGTAVGRSARRSVGRHGGRSVGTAVGRSARRSVGRRDGWSTGPVGRPVRGGARRLVGGAVRRSVGARRGDRRRRRLLPNSPTGPDETMDGRRAGGRASACAEWCGTSRRGRRGRHRR
jgi:hypothetical protein